MFTTVLKQFPGRTELWARDDDYDYLVEALGRSGVPYEEIRDPLSDAKGFVITEPGVDAGLIRQALDATGVTLPWVPATPRTMSAEPGKLRAGQYSVELLPIADDPDRVALVVRDGEGNVVDPKRPAALARDVRPVDVAAALPPDTVYAPNQLHEILEAVRNASR